jgi:O-antigen/teichoic acid export membrane protein
MSELAVPLLRELSTEEFISGSRVLPILVAGMVIYNFYRISIYILHLEKKTYLLTVFLVVTAIVNVALCVVLVPKVGISGAAISALVAYCVLAVLSIVIGFRYIRFDLSWRFLFKSVVASSVMAMCLFFVHPLGILQVIATVLLGAVVYFIAMFVFKGFGKSEVRELVGVFVGR